MNQQIEPGVYLILLTLLCVVGFDVAGFHNDQLFTSNYYHTQFAYDRGLNGTWISLQVTKIPEKYFNGVTNVYFMNATMTNRVGDYHYTYTLDKYADNTTISHLRNAEVRIYSDAFVSKTYFQCVLLHELGHHRQIMTTHLNNLSEDYANDFAYANGCPRGIMCDKRLHNCRGDD